MLGEEKEELVAETVNKGLLVHTLCFCSRQRKSEAAGTSNTE
jgi:hypothetical protein